MYQKGRRAAKPEIGFWLLLSGEWILNDGRTFDKEGYVVESERFWLVCVPAEGCPSGVDAAFRGSCRCV